LGGVVVVLLLVLVSAPVPVLVLEPELVVPEGAVVVPSGFVVEPSGFVVEPFEFGVVLGIVSVLELLEVELLSVDIPVPLVSLGAVDVAVSSVVDREAVDCCLVHAPTASSNAAAPANKTLRFINHLTVLRVARGSQAAFHVASWRQCYPAARHLFEETRR